MSDIDADPKAISRRRGLRIGTAVMAVVALVPSCLGFGNKLIELFSLAGGGGEGAFAVVPLCNYMMATVGFACLLAWATANGMFRNIEQPKVDFFARERQLDTLWGTGPIAEEASHG